MAKRHDIPVTADVEGVLNDRNKALIRKAIRTVLEMEGVGICQLSQQDVVRHVMVQRIIEAYAKYEDRKGGVKK